MPVGDPYAVSLERQPAPGPYFVVRNVEWDGMRASHQGADLGSGAAGDLVRASASGLVVRAADRGEYGGYGTHVVLAHRLPEGVLVYSVYAHLRQASIRVKPGQFVQAGAALGRVGMTGRASAPHLHFEIRVARDPEERWEFADVEDPLAFIEERLPAHRGDTTGVPAFLEWGEFASLLAPHSRGDDVLTRERWWRMLAVAARGPFVDPALPGALLGDSLADAGLLTIRAGMADERAVLAWTELARDLSRLRRAGLRLGHGPLRRPRHEAVFAGHFGEAAPSQRTSELSARTGTPSLTDAVLLLADLSGPVPEPARPAKPVTGGGVAKAKGPRSDSLAARAAMAARGGPGRTRADSLAAKPATGARIGPARARSDSLPVKAGTAARSGAAGARVDSSAARSVARARTAAARPPADSLARTRSAPGAGASRARPDSLAPAPRVAPRRDSLPPAPVPAPPAPAADTSGPGPP